MAEYGSGLSSVQVRAGITALKPTLGAWRRQSPSDGIRETWRLLRLEGWVELAAFECGDVDEVQATRIRGHAVQYVHDVEDAVRGASESLGQRGHYVVPARLKPGVEATADVGVWSRAKTTSKEKDVVRSLVLVVDCDPERPANTSSTKIQWLASVGTAGCVMTTLGEAGVGEGALGIAHSGNGAHVHIYLDIPWSTETKELRMRILKGLGVLCGYRGETVTVKIDASMADGARYVPLYGTMKRKGGRGHLDRPWRRTAVSGPAEIKPLDLDGLRALADALDQMSGARATVATSTGSEGTHDVPLAPQSNNSKRPVDLLERAGRYAAKCPPAVAGEKGHGTAFRVICNVVRGFDLDPQTALQALAPWNSRCTPPWSEAELRHKIADAREKGQRPDLGAFLRQPKGRTAHVPGPGRAPAGGDGRNEDGSDHDVPVIRVDVDTDRVIEEAVAALAQDPEVYVRGTVLVRAIPTDRGLESCELPASVLRLVHLARAASWQVSTQQGWVPAKTPSDIATAVHQLQVWPGIRQLLNIVDVPVMRADGTVLDRPGYDAETRLLYVPTLEFGEIPGEPTLEDALAARDRLLDIVADFPLLPSGRATWLALILSYFARPMFRGPTPGFILDANVRGCGKGLLADVTGVICVGARLPVTTPTADEEELRKRITSTLMRGRGIVLVDNLPNDGELGNATWDRLLTGASWEDRVLGESTVVAVPNLTLWLYTANNVQVRGDTTRRVFHIRLETPLEHPEHRKPTEFKHADLLAHVEQERVSLVRDILTILRAWVVAGRSRGTVTLGSYEPWCQTIGSCVEWLGLGDVTKTQEEYRARAAAGAGDAAPLRPLMAAWRAAFGAAEATAARVLTTIRDEDERVRREQRRLDRGGAAAVDDSGDVGLDDDALVHRYQALRDAILGFAPAKSGALPTPSWLGRRLSGVLLRVVDGHRYEAREDRDGITHWRLVEVGAGASSENDPAGAFAADDPAPGSHAAGASGENDPAPDQEECGVICGGIAGAFSENDPALNQAELMPDHGGCGGCGGISAAPMDIFEKSLVPDGPAPDRDHLAGEPKMPPQPPHLHSSSINMAEKPAGASSKNAPAFPPHAPAFSPAPETNVWDGSTPSDGLDALSKFLIDNV